MLGELKSALQIVQIVFSLSNIYGGFKEKKPRVHLKKSVTIRAGQGGGHIPSLVIEGKAKDFSLDDFKNCFRKVPPLKFKSCQPLQNEYQMFEITKPQEFRAFGNGWTVDVIAHIFRNIKQ